MMRAYTSPPACLLWSRQYAVATRLVRKCPRKCVRMTRSHSSGDIEKIIRSRSTPALFTRMSSRPNSRSAVASRSCAVDHSPMSPVLVTALPPAALISAAVSSAPFRSMSLMTRLAPAAASPRASARPIPWPAPVTIAARPSRLTASVIPAPLSVPGSGQHAAIDHELAACAVGRLIRGEVDHQMGDLRRLRETRYRQRPHEVLAVWDVRKLLERRRGHCRHDAARVYRVDADAELAELLGSRPGDAADPELAGAVGRQAGGSGEAFDGRDID